MANPTVAVPARLVDPTDVESTDGEKVVYTCPSTFGGAATFGAIIKSVRMCTATSTSQTCSWGILKAGQTAGTGPRFLLQDMDLGPSNPFTDEVTEVLAPGDRIIVAVTGAAVTVTVSGAVLV